MNGKKGYRIKFELSFAGLLGVGVICFCIFLWMFLLGLWAGQSGLLNGMSFVSKPAIPLGVKPEGQRGKIAEPRETPPSPLPAPGVVPDVVTSSPVTPVVVPRVEPVARVAVQNGATVMPSAQPEKTVAPVSTVVAPAPAAATPVAHAVAPGKAKNRKKEAPFYAIQVGAFRTDKGVEEEMRIWRGRGYEAFSRPPEGEKENLIKVCIGHYPDAAAARKQLERLPVRKKNPPVIVMIKPDQTNKP